MKTNSNLRDGIVIEFKDKTMLWWGIRRFKNINYRCHPNDEQMTLLLYDENNLNKVETMLMNFKLKYKAVQHVKFEG